MVAGPTVGTSSGAYSIPLASPAVGGGSTNGAPSVDIYGNSRSGRNDVGAVQVSTANLTAIVVPGSVSFGDVVAGSSASTQTLTLFNYGGALSGIAVTVANTAGTAFSRPTGNAGGSCGTTLQAGSANNPRTCTINVSFNPGTTAGADTGTVTITTTTNGVTITNSPVPLTGTVVPQSRTASVSPGTLAFGNQPAGFASSAQTVTVANTGNTALAGLTYTLGGGTPQPFTRPAGNAGGTCGATLAVGASCTVNVVFTPPANSAGTNYSGTLTVAGTGATVTPASVTLTGASVPPPVPAAPTNGNSTRGNNGGPVTASLSWTAPLYAASFDVQWSTSQTTINANSGTVITNATTTTSYTFTAPNSVTSGTTVYFKVRAVNVTGAGGWSTVFSSTVR
jgi:hypothetical protein